jgi:ATP-dependent Lhr-like helicase
VTQSALAAPLALEETSVAGALAALESEGTILRGRFDPGVNDEQWCDRRLLARINHTTIRRLRSEIEPVAPRDFLRFLFAWQHVGEDTRLEGPHALSTALTVLEGFEAPARAWETEILPARLEGYEPAWLDAHCIAGRAMWARLAPPANGKSRARTATPVRSTPIALLDRRRLPLWISHLPQTNATAPSPRAQLLLDCLHAQGALFFDELAEASHLLRPQVEEALGELVALGLVTSDSFAGLRGLLVRPTSAGQSPGPSGAGGSCASILRAADVGP